MDEITKTVISVMWILLCLIIMGFCFMWILSNSDMYNNFISFLYNSIPLPDNNKQVIISYVPSREQIITKIIHNDINQICAANYNKPIGEELNLTDLNNQDSKSENLSYVEPERCDAQYGTIEDIDWHAYVYGYRPRIILY